MRRLLLAYGVLIGFGTTLTPDSGLLGQPNATESSRPLIGAKIYEYKGDFPKLFDQWRSIGLNTVFASESLVRTPGFMTAARQRKLGVYVIAPIFFNPQALASQPELWAITGYGERARDDWVEFVCPSRPEYRRNRVEWIKRIVSEVQPDAISIDFIRHFIFWEKVGPNDRLDPLNSSCFCPLCLRAFETSERITIPKKLTTTRDQAQWIVTNHLPEWSEWKCRTITSMVETIARETRASKPSVKLVVHLVPWREKDFNGGWKTIVGQDVRALSRFVDVLSPMCYAHMVRQDAAWIHAVVEDVQRRGAGRAVIPAIQVKEAYRPEIMTAAEFGEHLGQALLPPSQGVAFWEWPALERDGQKREILRSVATKVR